MKKCFSCESKFIVKSDYYQGYICGECGYFITYENYNEYVKKYKEYIERVKEERRKKILKKCILRNLFFF